MAGRRKYNRSGLLALNFGKIFFLIFTLWLFSAFFAVAEEDQEPEILTEQESRTGQDVVIPLEVLIQHEPAVPVAGSEWTLILLVSHGRPNEVSVLDPSFSGDFTLQQVIKGPRFRTDDDDQPFSSIPEPIVAGRRTWRVVEFERWTAIEYRFMMHNPGTVFFDSFTVVTPQGRERTTPFRIVVQRPSNTVTTTMRRFQLNWTGTPADLRVGESAEFRLLARNWSGSLPDAGRLMPQAPQGHILESLPLSGDEKNAGIVLKLRVLPANPVPFVLETYRVPYNGTEFVIPQLRIPVSRVEAGPVENAPDDLPEMESYNPPLPFPSAETAISVHTRLHEKYTAEFEAVYRTAYNFWETGNRAGALAALRQHERDHRAGELFASIRREAEKTLGLDGTNNEQKTSLLRRLLWFFGRRNRLAVLKETDFRHIPDPAGEVIGRFSEGQPVVVSPVNKTRNKTGHTASGRRDTWLRVITNDSGNITGWVPEESIIIY